MRAIVVVLPLVAAWMTGCGGGQCVWIPGGDGSCPDNSGGGGTNYIEYGSPQWISAAGTNGLLVTSSDTYLRDENHEEIDAQTGETIAVIGHGIHRPALACANDCILGWHDVHDESGTSYSVRADGVWTPSKTLAGAYQVAVAAFGDTFFVTWLASGSDNDVSVELAQIDRHGVATSDSTIAHGAALGHIAIAASASGGVVSWQASGTPARVFAQLFGPDGSPVGDPLALEAELDDGYYSASAAAFVDGTYRVVHGGLGDGVPWFVVDPSHGTIAPGMIRSFDSSRAITEITPLARGAVLEVTGSQSSAVQIENDAIVLDVALGHVEAPSVLPVGDSFRAAYSNNGSIYTEELGGDLAPLTEPNLVLERGADEGGCNAAGGGSPGLAVFLLVLTAVSLGRRRRVAFVGSAGYQKAQQLSSSPVP